MIRTWYAIALVLALGCKSGGIPADAKTTVLSFAELDCAECGEEMARALITSDGVYKTAFDKRKAELTVIADDELNVLSLAQTKKPKKEEWRLVLGAGKGSYLAWKQAPEAADVKQLARDGEDVPDLKPHLAPGKVTIVDFSAKWCEPCRVLDEHVLELLSRRSDVAYRKLDVGDWDTPLGKRYLSGIDELPYVIVFDKNGKTVDSVTGLDLARIDRAVERAAGAPSE
jgi:thiol-disulfide isomerase/thioredoxin